MWGSLRHVSEATTTAGGADRMHPSRDHEAFDADPKALIQALIEQARPLVGDDGRRRELDEILDQIDELLAQHISSAASESGFREPVASTRGSTYAAARG
jgi:hypothetical protein